VSLAIPRPSAVAGAVRLMDWIHFLALPLLSAGAWPFAVGPVVLAVLAAACILGFAFGYNQWKDENLAALPEAELVAATGMGSRAWRTTLVVCVVGGLACAALVNVESAGAAAFSLVWGWLYSGGPRVKRWPVVGTIANVAIFAPLALLGSGTSEPAARFWFVLCFALLLVENQLIHEAAHADDDRRGGVQTTTVRFGHRVSGLLAVAMGLGAAASLAVLADGNRWVLGTAVAMAVMALLLLVSVRHFRRPDRARRLRLAHRWAAFCLGGAAWAFHTFGAPL